MRYLLAVLVVLASCGSDETRTHGGAVGTPSGGEPDLVPVFTTFASASDGLAVPRDLEFHPDRPGELWIVNRAIDGTVILFNAGTPQQSSRKIVDAYGDHFMEEVSSMAFGARNTFATCQESQNTYNHHAPANNFMGPALWPADLSIYGKVNQSHQGLLGSHIDMLHESPLCMGIAHHKDNAFWVFDGLNGGVVYYDFAVPHGPGEDDHADGIVRRYRDVRVTRAADVPSHLVLDHATGWLYIVDTGAARVLRLDTKTGSKTRALPSLMEPLREYSEYGNATVETFVGAGLQQPSGVALAAGKLLVSDHATGEIVSFDLESGAELGRLATGAAGIMGLTVDPQGRVWFVDAEADQVVRIDYREE